MLVEPIDSSGIVCHDGIVTDGRLGVSVVVQIGFYMYCSSQARVIPIIRRVTCEQGAIRLKGTLT